MKMNKLLLWIVAILACNVGFAEEKPKNILIFFVDDLAQRDIAIYGNDFHDTPNVDRLAREGVMFDNAYSSSPVCSPTRVGLMTGLNPARVGITDYHGTHTPEACLEHPQFSQRKLLPARNKEYLALDRYTFAEYFRDHGYNTFFAGKWHLGPEGYWPEDQGFDINKGGWTRGGPYGGNQYFSPYGNPRLTDGPEGEYLPERLANETVKFIEKHKDDRFVALFSFYSVHTPLMASDELVKKYQERAKDLGPPKFEREGEYWTRTSLNHAVYGAMVEAMDNAVGSVMDALERLGLLDDTIVIFTSDNGGLSTLGSQHAPSVSLPFRAGKGWIYEGGIRVPFIIRAPHSQTVNVSDAMTLTDDIFPTIAELAGLPLPDEMLVGMDGISIVPALRGESLSRDSLFFHYPHYSPQGCPPAGAIRQKNWKLIEFYEGGIELYDLETDIGERIDLSREFPHKALRMSEKLVRWRAEVGAIMPTPNPLFSDNE
jgi:arylsulfatase A-like enzyme